MVLAKARGPLITAFGAERDSGPGVVQQLRLGVMGPGFRQDDGAHVARSCHLFGVVAWSSRGMTALVGMQFRVPPRVISGTKLRTEK